MDPVKQSKVMAEAVLAMSHHILGTAPGGSTVARRLHDMVGDLEHIVASYAEPLEKAFTEVKDTLTSAVAKGKAEIKVESADTVTPKA